MAEYENVILNGFRATGKSTIAPLLAARMHWNLVDMDIELTRRLGKSIPEFTDGGRIWFPFRQEEAELLKELLKTPRLVISAGGGVPVNDIIDPTQGRTFGSLNAETIQASSKTLSIILFTSDAVIAERLRLMAKSHGVRPSLSARTIASMADVDRDTSLSDEDKLQRKIELSIQENLKAYHQRRPLYQALSSHRFDTGKLSKEEVVREIMDLLRG